MIVVPRHENYLACLSMCIPSLRHSWGWVCIHVPRGVRRLHAGFTNHLLLCRLLLASDWTRVYLIQTFVHSHRHRNPICNSSCKSLLRWLIITSKNNCMTPGTGAENTVCAGLKSAACEVLFRQQVCAHASPLLCNAAALCQLQPYPADGLKTTRRESPTSQPAWSDDTFLRIWFLLATELKH